MIRQRVNFKCDKCGGPVWKDVEFSGHIELCCLYCGKLWFVKKELLNKVLKRKLYEKYAKNRSVIVS